jgi:RNase P/RNase MRP subunit p29
MITKREFIGKKAEIRYSGSLFKGTIIDETKNLFYLKTDKKLVKIVKKNSTIKINDNIINGKKMAKRPEDRIKK